MVWSLLMLSFWVPENVFLLDKTQFYRKILNMFIFLKISIGKSTSVHNCTTMSCLAETFMVKCGDIIFVC